jgi:dolichol-phosphate mannosyltransferase
LQDPPEIIPKMLALWREGYDVVYGIRKRRKEWWGKRCMYFLFYRIIRSMTRSVNLPPDSGDFSLMSRRVVRALGAMPERNRYVRGLRSWVGYRQIGLPYEREARHKGVTKYSFRKLFHLAYDGIFSFSYVPLRAITIIGFLGALLSFVAVLVVVYLRLFTNLSIPGFASLASIVLFLGGVQVMALGIVGEYIRRIYDETKERPNYIVSEEGGFTETHGRKII